MSYDLENCRETVVDFIYADSDPEVQSVQDDLLRDLSKIGIRVNAQSLDGETFWSSDALLNGEYNIRFARTWGAPYDPHSFLTYWTQEGSPTYEDLANLEPPLTREAWIAKVERVQSLLNEGDIQLLWKEILNDIHQQATAVPLWGTRIPYILNRRLEDFVPGAQILAFPLETIRVINGSKNVSINGGDDGNFFTSAYSLNPHLYETNLFYVTSWVYEGLVGYGDDGEIVPVLATDWNKEITTDGQRVTFTLREGVKFHDGSDFNCSVAKLNFDHVLSDTMRERHSWYGTPRFLKNWFCTDEGQFVLETSQPFYPLLQELTYIRPLVFASASSFTQGLNSDPDLHNSCESGHLGESYVHLEENVTCAGLLAPIGTGAFKYVGREALSGDNSIDAKVLFARNENYWGDVPDIEFIELRYYPDNDAVYDALLSEELDMTMGIGPLTALQVQEIKNQHSAKFDVRHSEVTQNAVLLLNTARSPTNDIDVRKAIIHGLNKAEFVDKEFAGLEQPASQLMPYSLPYTDIDLTPKWSYDYDKAASINCPFIATANSASGELSGGAIAGIVVSSVALVALVSLIAVMIRREKQGVPMFASEPKRNEETVYA